MDQAILFPMVANAALLLAMVSLYDTFPLVKQARPLEWFKVLLGLVFGGFSILVIYLSHEFSGGTHVDTSTVLLSVSGLYFGSIPTLIAMGLSCLYRYSLGGPAVFASMLSIVLSACIGLLWRFKLKGKLIDIAPWQLLLMGFMVHLGGLGCLFLQPLPSAFVMLAATALPVILIYPPLTLLIGLLLSRRFERERGDNIDLQDDFLFRSQFNVGNIGIAITSVDKHWIRVNPRLCQMFKLSEQELLSMNWPDISHPDDLERDLEFFNQMIAGEIDQYEMNKRFYAKDGSLVNTHMTVACKRTHGKVQLVIAGFMDISDQTMSEMRLLASREQLSLVLASSDLGFWDWDIKSGMIVRNERCAQMLGVSMTEMIENTHIWVEAVHSLDKVRFLRALDLHLNGETPNYHLEYRICAKNGQVKWLRDTGRVMLRDDDGNAVRMCGIHVDITEERQNHEQLELAASVYNTSTEAMSVIDDAGRIITINAAFSAVTGYQEAQVLGQHINMFQCRRNAEHFFREINQQLLETGRWQGEMWQRRKNGDEYLAWLTVNTILDPNHRPYRWVALFSDITEKRAQEQLIWQQANYDLLTGLPNRRMLLDYLDREIALAERQHSHFALMFLDLDFFKEVNDSLGHDMGDKLLKECANRILGSVRESDVVARIGGDEFTVMLRDIKDSQGVERVTNQILSAVAKPYSLGQDTAYISASIGITLFPDDATSRETLLKNADQAMYAAKEQGRNRFYYFTQSMQEHARFRMRLIQDLRVAIEKQQFVLNFQPIVHMASGAVQKAEALIRWHHSERGLVSPADFIPVAEDTGLIMEIGTWVFESAARQSRDWQQRFGKRIQLSVNKSPIQFRDEGKSVERWIELLKELDLTVGGICIEITEGLLLDASSGVSAKLLAYRDAGIEISLDDFGTGYSSLAYLKKFDIDYLKIDQSFTQSLEMDSSDRSLCEAIIVMAHKLGMKVIAEGVETAGQRDILLAMGCDFGQGYFYSKPLSAKDFENRYLNSALHGIEAIKAV